MLSHTRGPHTVWNHKNHKNKYVGPLGISMAPYEIQAESLVKGLRKNAQHGTMNVEFGKTDSDLCFDK